MHHGHDLERWPLHDTLVLGAQADAVPSARAHLRHILRQWGHAELAADASVVISSRWGWHPARITGLTKVTWAEWHLPPEPELPGCLATLESKFAPDHLAEGIALHHPDGRRAAHPARFRVTQSSGRGLSGGA